MEHDVWKVIGRHTWQCALVLSLSIVSSGCVFLHSVQLSEVDSKVVLEGKRFEIRISEQGFNLQEGAKLVEVFANTAGQAKGIREASQIIALFQMGPKTGNPVFSDDYSDDLIHQLKLKCPSGRISGLSSIRETSKYPVVSGEIVKLIGYCLEGENT
jgi:hypothetical protein